jgi:hypothetical protein
VTVAATPRAPFVVTGCGRSGTRYTANLLTAAGFPCGHEQLFSPWTRDHAALVLPAGQGDSSWLAVPHLARLPNGAVVIHQVRHPLRTISSHLGIRYFETRFRWQRSAAWAKRWALDLRNLGDGRSHRLMTRPYTSWGKRHCPDVYDEPTELARTIRYWLDWNRRAEAATHLPHVTYLRVRVEDLDLGTLRSITDALGGADDEVLRRALTTVPRDRNTRRKGPEVRWDGLPDHLREPVRELARRYGYDE